MLAQPNIRHAARTASPFEECIAMASGHRNKHARGGSGGNPRHGPSRSGTQFVPAQFVVSPSSFPKTSERPTSEAPEQSTSCIGGVAGTRDADERQPEPLVTSSPFGLATDADADAGTPALHPQARAEASEAPDEGDAREAGADAPKEHTEQRSSPPLPRPSRFQRFSALEPPRVGAGSEPTSAPRAEDDDEIDYSHHPDVRGEVGPLIDTLKSLFEQDRGISAGGGSSRCGLCYLHYPLSQLEYREREGFYICADCERALGSAEVFMVRRQQR